MRVLVIGASRGTGRVVVRAALAAGHHVRAFARSAGSLAIDDAGLEERRGDALRQGDVASALDGVDAVVQALGVRGPELFRPVSLFSAATRALVPEMERLGVRRLVAVTGFGAGDSGQAVGPLERVPFRLLLGRAYDDKSAQERLIRDSALDWTIVRPGVLAGAGDRALQGPRGAPAVAQRLRLPRQRRALHRRGARCEPVRPARPGPGDPLTWRQAQGLRMKFRLGFE
ncbi:MAG: NAD(P)H-binding protein [Acetobacteraceae bacterium]|nr:NAD(P)H-binding protein [Acetobacteraceae bacterium]